MGGDPKGLLWSLTKVSWYAARTVVEGDDGCKNRYDQFIEALLLGAAFISKYL
ncbi:MAG: hypothetical protein KJ804_07785 [Proteobacteria bacterium]|nr:hypothetical protein [Pseudomonadota bacterium]MBU1058201.1 hypothetical protein [Pseudomonadota bacterium]